MELPPDLGSGRPGMGLDIGRIRELVREEDVRVARAEIFGHLFVVQRGKGMTQVQKAVGARGKSQSFPVMRHDDEPCEALCREDQADCAAGQAGLWGVHKHWTDCRNNPTEHKWPGVSGRI